MSQTGSGPSGYTYSPDGRWWWDGRAWQPVPGAPGPGPTPARGGGPWLLATVIAVVVVSTLTLAVGGAMLAVHAIHSAPPFGVSPFGSYLADASVTGVEAAARSHGLQCGTGVSIGTPVHACHRTSRGEVMSVSVVGPDSSHVAVVSVAVLGLRPEDRSAALDLFQAVVVATVAGQDASADADWVSANFDQVGTNQTTVGGVTLQLAVTGSRRSLFIHPAGP